MKKKALEKLDQFLLNCAEITQEERETIMENINAKKTTVHIIQEEFQGIPNDPVVFLDEKKADGEYLEILKGYVRDKEYYTVDIYSIQDALNFASMMQDDDYILRYWKIVSEE